MGQNSTDFRTRWIGFGIEKCLKFIGATTRLLIRNDEVIRQAREQHGGLILASWHGRTFLPIYHFRGQPLRAVVSLSQDGEYAAQVFQRLGWSPIRGSTNKGSARVLLTAVRSLRKGQILALTPDGPRGPARKVAAGVIHLAAVSGCPVIPMGVGLTRSKTLRSWDDYAIPYPLSTGVIVLGEPFYVTKGLSEEEVRLKTGDLENRLNALEAEAEALAAGFEARRNYLLYNSGLLVLSPLVALYFLRMVFLGKRTRMGLKMQLGNYYAVHKAWSQNNGYGSSNLPVLTDPTVTFSYQTSELPDSRDPSGDNGTGSVIMSRSRRKPPRFWIHAVSVGEVIAASPVVRALRERFPEAVIVVSTTTDTGQETARKSVPEADSIVYFPFDLPWAVNHALDAVHPDLFMMVETELWPNFLHNAALRGVPVVLVNGRISDRALRNYRRVPGFWKWMANNVTLFAMRSETDASRVRRLGVRPGQVFVTGDVKLDQPIRSLDGELVSLLRESLGLRQEEELLLAGSTHPREEEMLLDAWWQARIRHGNLRLLLAPRHLERIPEIERLVHEKGFRSVRKTDITRNGMVEGGSPCVILLDTLGELSRLYAAAEVAFVGGSLIPRGGHNVLEPGFQGKPVLFGPYMDNFRDAAALLTESGVGFQVGGPQEMVEKIDLLLQSPELRASVRRKAQQVLERNQGAARRIIDLVATLLPEDGEAQGASDYDGNGSGLAFRRALDPPLSPVALPVLETIG